MLLPVWLTRRTPTPSSAPTDFTVTLTVTDNEGATGVATAAVHVVPPPPGVEGCTTDLAQGRVECILDIPVQSTMKLKLLQINCDIQGNRVTTPPPIGDQVFLNVCIDGTVDQELAILGAPPTPGSCPGRQSGPDMAHPRHTEEGCPPLAPRQEA